MMMVARSRKNQSSPCLSTGTKIEVGESLSWTSTSNRINNYDHQLSSGSLEDGGTMKEKSYFASYRGVARRKGLSPLPSQLESRTCNLNPRSDDTDKENSDYRLNSWRQRQRRNRKRQKRQHYLCRRISIFLFCLSLAFVVLLVLQWISVNKEELVTGNADFPFETSFYNQIVKNSQENDNPMTTREHKAPPKCYEGMKDAIDTVDVSLVTQLSMDRLWMIEHHCRRWDNKISMIVYSIDSEMTAEMLYDKLMIDYHCSPHHLDAVQIYHGTKDEDYPVNKLRNLAISAISTTHFLYIDVDFWVSSNLYSSITSILRTNKYPSKNANINPNRSQIAIVIPAFQIFRACHEYIDCRSENLKIMPNDVMDLIQSIKKKHTLPFDPTNVHGHGSTMYKEWLGSQLQEAATGEPSDDIIALPCIHSDRYEPYVVVRYCDTLPPYQEAFVGYGKNKMTWIMHLQHYGYQFVHALRNGGFLVHYPHLESSDRQAWNDGPDMILQRKTTPKALRTTSRKQIDWMEYKRGQVDALYVKFRYWLLEQPARMQQKEYSTALCRDAPENQNEQDGKLWVNNDLLEKYDITEKIIELSGVEYEDEK